MKNLNIINNKQDSCMVSVGMPVYNDIKFLEKAINSILNQSYYNIELVISDDGSTDGSEQICRKYAKKDQRIRYIRQKQNIGISKNMKFLLDNASGDYFMWAANDDLWDIDFIKILIEPLQKRRSISAFCPVMFIDEEDQEILQVPRRSTDYSGNNPYERIKKLIRIFDDSMGYGLFIREEIMNVEFPVWWWINRKCPYNNIYPTICFYLTKGDFTLVGDKILWFNRLKKNENINHKIPYNDTFIRGAFAFILRKLNLVFFSIYMIIKAEKKLNTAMWALPELLWRWFFIPSANEIIWRSKSFLKGHLKFF